MKVLVYKIFKSADDIIETLNGMKIENVSASNGAEVTNEISRSKPDFVLDINYHTDIHQICISENIPYVVWSFDSGIRHSVHEEVLKNLRENDFFFLFNREDYRKCREFHEKVYYLPFSAPDSFIMEPRTSEFDYEILVLMNTYKDTADKVDSDFKQMLDSQHDETVKKLFTLIKSLMDLTIERHLEIFDRNSMKEFLDDFVSQCGVNPFNLSNMKTDKFCYSYGQVISFKQRELLLKFLYSKGVKADIFGDNYWKEIISPDEIRFHGTAPYENLPSIYNSAEINVNLTQIQNIESIPQRIFHLLACGSFVLTNHSDEIERFFKSGVHLETFRSKEEFLEKSLYYIRNKNKRAEIASAGHKEFLNNHKMSSRLSVILNTVTG